MKRLPIRRPGARRVLFMNHDMTAGGAERALLNLLSRLDRGRFQPTLWVRSRKGDLREAYEALGIEVREQRWAMQEGARRRLIWNLPVAAVGLSRFDVVHSFCSNAWWTEPWAVRLGRVPAYLIRKSDLYRHGPVRSWEVRERMADRIVAVTEHIAEAFYADGPASRKVQVIRNGVDTELFRPMPPDLELRRRLGVPEGGAVLACVANLSPYKGQLPVLIALALAKATDRTVHVVFAGRDLADGEVQRWAAELGVADRAHFVGLVNDVPRLLAGCDGMVLVSPREGCSNAVLEAMACGIPLVLSAAGAEELLGDGEAGFVIGKGELDRMVDRMWTLGREPELRRRMGEAARRRALAAFSLDRMAKEYMDLYDEVLEEKAR
ncbi:glycosyltransferase family 4 protein [Acidobacteria bacterium ACD]|nr:MAG: glycosyltransferase family 1 protein [Acidobacteriota bacterium]MCE7956325.1 glycosyltransferase family 1 protein [Acidobacteria bacterium ACB2]MDL1948429.1 glycosyltransferase family 4 protein [Acidobacteria bacterium ACD]